MVFVHTYRLVGLAAHDPQVDGVEGQLGEDTGQNGGDAAFRMEQAGGKAGQKAGDKGAQQGQPAVHAAADQHHGYGGTGGDGAVHGQVGHIQNTVGDVYADGHDAPYKTLRRRTGQRVQ